MQSWWPIPHSKWLLSKHLYSVIIMIYPPRVNNFYQTPVSGNQKLVSPLVFCNNDDLPLKSKWLLPKHPYHVISSFVVVKRGRNEHVMARLQLKLLADLTVVDVHTRLTAVRGVAEMLRGQLLCWIFCLKLHENGNIYRSIWETI